MAEPAGDQERKRAKSLPKQAITGQRGVRESLGPLGERSDAPVPGAERQNQLELMILGADRKR